MVVPSCTTSRRGLDRGVNVFSFYISVSLVLVLILNSDMFEVFFNKSCELDPLPPSLKCPAFCGFKTHYQNHLEEVLCAISQFTCGEKALIPLVQPTEL